MSTRWAMIVTGVLFCFAASGGGCGGGDDGNTIEDLGRWWLDVDKNDGASPDVSRRADNNGTDITGTDETDPKDDGPPCVPACDGLECGDDDGCGNPCIVDTGCSGNPPCSEGVCDQSGVCGILPTDADCDDENPCTIGDHCSQGKCKAGEEFPDCDDGNDCTNDLCDVETGCYSMPNSLPCDDGDPCTDGDLCVEGACESGGANLCDDLNSCTDDWCEPDVGCHNDPMLQGFPCDDMNSCTAGDSCTGGLCIGGPVMDCDDFNPCTTDICNPIDGCINQQKDSGTSCDDMDQCTVNDYCDLGVCKPGPTKDCDDFIDCTADSCKPGGICNHAPLTGDFYCNDDDPCTDPDSCMNGECVSGPPVAGCS